MNIKTMENDMTVHPAYAKAFATIFDEYFAKMRPETEALEAILQQAEDCFLVQRGEIIDTYESTFSGGEISRIRSREHPAVIARDKSLGDLYHAYDKSIKLATDRYNATFEPAWQDRAEKEKQARAAIFGAKT